LRRLCSILGGDIVRSYAEILFHLIYRVMSKLLAFVGLLLVFSGSFAQVIGRVDKKTKEFSIAAGQKVNYMIFGYRFANATTEKYICFASNEDVERANGNLPLGSYYDTDRLPTGSKIVYLGAVGTYGKMSFNTGGGKKIIFYLPKSSFVIK